MTITCTLCGSTDTWERFCERAMQLGVDPNKAQHALMKAYPLPAAARHAWLHPIEAMTTGPETAAHKLFHTAYEWLLERLEWHYKPEPAAPSERSQAPSGVFAVRTIDTKPSCIVGGADARAEGLRLRRDAQLHDETPAAAEVAEAFLIWLIAHSPSARDAWGSFREAFMNG